MPIGELLLAVAGMVRDRDHRAGQCDLAAISTTLEAAQRHLGGLLPAASDDFDVTYAIAPVAAIPSEPPTWRMLFRTAEADTGLVGVEASRRR